MCRLGWDSKRRPGSYKLKNKFYTATGPVDFPADQTIQPGDGGWGVGGSAQGFRQMTERFYGYVFGSYMASPKSESDVRSIPVTGAFWSVPDVYSARLGGAFSSPLVFRIACM